MSAKKRPNQVKPQQLLVEGINDRYVISNLSEQNNIQETFSIIIPDDLKNEDQGGIERLLSIIPRKLKEQNLQTLGIVADTDQNLLDRWKALTNNLKKEGYQNIPAIPPPQGWVGDQQIELPKIGVWLMPNNQRPGILEDFVKTLIPENDLLLVKAKAIIREIETEKLNRYSEVDHAKALIHTWLAWQKDPGQPMGQAITAKVLQSDHAVQFVEWLNRLFN